MPYMNIFQTTDGKWHKDGCSLLTEASKNGISQTVGSTATKPPPPRKSLCVKCLDFGQDVESFCRAYRCETCLPDDEIWVIHHDDSKEHTCQWCRNKTKYIREVPKRKPSPSYIIPDEVTP